MKLVDLRSDTVTQPTPEMRAAMASAEVGDDVMGEDPTVNRLEALAAEKMGKEAGLFVASGTMGNLVAVLTHCNRGDEMILGNLSHTFLYEAGGSAALGGVHSYVLPNQPDGSLALADIEAAFRADDPHFPASRLLVLENTHNRCGGTVLGPDYLSQVGELVRRLGLRLHIDGARIFNAAAALGLPVQALTREADSISFCLSKGLCAPVGSVLCGSKAFIARARRIRKQLGGGMRQAGVLAAAGIIALEAMPGRLVEDHRRARQLAQGLSKISGLIVENPFPATNMVFAHLSGDVPLDGETVIKRMAVDGVKIGLAGERRFRLVTHYWIDDEGVERAVESMRKVLQ